MPWSASVKRSARRRRAIKWARHLLEAPESAGAATSNPLSLLHHASRATSQNLEDGMIAEALRRMGIDSPRFVEVGAHDGSENCTRHVLDNGGSGLWLEGNPDSVERARAIAPPDRLDARALFVTAENIADTIASSPLVADGFDLLVVDIDGNDWWVLRAILERWSPRLVVAEYVAGHGPRRRYVMPYDPAYVWDGSIETGASLASMDDLARSFGYRLVACDPDGVNGFWVREADAALFATSHSPRDHFRITPDPQRRVHFRPEVARVPHSTGPDDLAAITIGEVSRVPSRDGARAVYAIEVRNGSRVPISSRGPRFVHVGYSTRGARPGSEPKRARIYSTIEPGDTGFVHVLVHGDDIEWVAPVLERVAWGPRTAVVSRS